MVKPNGQATIDTISHLNVDSNGKASPALAKVANLLRLDTFSLGSWNLQGGLSDGCSFQCVAKDLSKRRVDIACLQETHKQVAAARCSEGEIICLEDSDKTPTRQRYGLGFFIGPAFADHVVDHQLYSNRIAVLRLHSAHGGAAGSPRRKFNTICIVNVYAPTAQRATKFPEEYHGFYKKLHEVVGECRRHSVATFIAGDFNSKLGLRQTSESGELEAFMGDYGKGTRNHNGGYLASFLTRHKMYAANTHCLHKMRHRSSWGGVIRRENGTKLRIRNQIDYICVQQRLSQAIIDGRSYWATRHSSDHAIVVVRLKLSNVYKIRSGLRREGVGDCSRRVTNPGGESTVQHLQVNSLTCAEVRAEYQEKVCQLCPEGEHITLSCLADRVKQAAQAVLKERDRRPDCQIEYFDDHDIRVWSKERMQLLCKLREMSTPRFSQEEEGLRSERMKLALLIRKQIRKLRQVAVNKVATEVEETRSIQRRFAATQVLKKKQPYQALCLVDACGFKSTNPAKTIPLAEAHYKKFFNPEGSSSIKAIDPFGEYHGALEVPLDSEELMSAMKQLANGRAAGPDGVPGELLKYGGIRVAEAMAVEINDMFITRKFIPALVEGLAAILNKPGKPSEVVHTRPINMLNVKRKVLSSATLERGQEKFDAFLPRSQCGFRRKRSSMDVAWMYGFLKAVGTRYDRAVHVMGIDMSKAFDSINRQKLLWVLEHGVGLRTTELRLIRVLLAETKLRIKSRGKLGNWFDTVLGIPQGDALSPILFVVYLESAMREVRDTESVLYGHTMRLRGQYIGRDFFGEIMEASYADDVDFICVDKTRLDRLQEVMVPVFADEYNLTINQSKTERIMFATDARIKTGYKKLGTHVDTDEDLKLRITKATIAYDSMWNLWKCNKISIPTRLKLYNALVKSILLYNIGATAYREVQLEKLDSLHRRHLRYMLGIFYPTVVSTTELYQRAQTHPIRVDIAFARWRYFRKALLQDQTDERLPCPCVMRLYFHCHFEDLSTKRGAPVTSLPVLINRDLRMVGRKFSSPEDYKKLREEASNKKTWVKLMKSILQQTVDKREARVVKQRHKRKVRAMQQQGTATGNGDSKRCRRAEVESRSGPGDGSLPDETVAHLACEANVPQANVTRRTRTRSTTAKRPRLTPIPSNRPTTKRKRPQSEGDTETAAKIMRVNRRDECANVNNCIISGVTF